MTTLRDIMTAEVLHVSPELALPELIELLISRHIGGAPVVSGHKVLGVVSATDVLSFAGTISEEGDRLQETSGEEKWQEDSELGASEEEEAAGFFTEMWDDQAPPLEEPWDDMAADGRRGLSKYTVADVMSRNVLSLPPATDVAAAAEFMKRAAVHRVLVMSGDKLEGIVSSMDIVNAVAEHQIPPAKFVLPHEADFDSGWSHEPIVREG